MAAPPRYVLSARAAEALRALIAPGTASGSRPRRIAYPGGDGGGLPCVVPAVITNGGIGNDWTYGARIYGNGIGQDPTINNATLHILPLSRNSQIRPGTLVLAQRVPIVSADGGDEDSPSSNIPQT